MEIRLQGGQERRIFKGDNYVLGKATVVQFSEYNVEYFIGYVRHHILPPVEQLHQLIPTFHAVACTPACLLG